MNYQTHIGGNTVEKGKSLLLFPDNYVMVDTETTGLSPKWDHVLEISALKVVNGQTVNEFSQLIKYSENYHVPAFITDLTGITTQLVQTQGIPPFQAISEFKDFLGTDLMAGYNINFDINFLFSLYQEFNLGTLSNDFVDIWRIARRFFKEEKHNRVSDVLPRLGIDHDQKHRGLSDCYDQKIILDKIRQSASNEIFKKIRSARSKKTDLRTLVSTSNDFNPDNPFFMKNVCFTGTLSMIRKEAAQRVVDVGGVVQNGVTRQTDFLIVGDTSYSKNVKNGITGKMKKAINLKSLGQDIDIIPETLFTDMVEEENVKTSHN